MDIIDAKKKASNIQRESRKDSKPTHCLLCGKETSRFCNSHSVPQFILKNITVNGEVLNAAYAIEIPIVSSKDGINRSGTFSYICHDCDNKYFADYENERALLNEPTNRIMAEIALKDTIQLLSKRNYEISLYKLLQNEFHAYENKEFLDEIHQLDIRDYSFEMKRAKKIIDKELKSGYVVLFSELLPYRTPIAAQSGITLDKDIDGGIINEINNISDDSMTQRLHCGIFPLRESTRVILCRHKDDRRYMKFERQFNRLSFNKKLEYINYIVIKYTENYFLSPTIKDIVDNHERLRALSQEVYGSPNFGYSTDVLSDFAYIPVTSEEIPCFLDAEYQLSG